MSDDAELIRRLAAANPAIDSQVAGLDLRDAETELLEEIMATTNTDDPEVDLYGRPPWRPPRHIAFRTIVAAAAVVALIGGFLLSKPDGPDADDESSFEVAADGATGNADLPRLVPGDVPGGLDLTSFVTGGMASPWEFAAFYGHQADTDSGIPVVDLSIRWTVANEGASHGPPSGFTPTPVRGHDGYTCEGTACAGLGAGVESGVEWTERPGTWFSMTSPSLTAAQLVAIADGLEIGSHEVDPAISVDPSVVTDADEVDLGTVPEDLPVELERLGRRTYIGPELPYEVTVDEDGNVEGPTPPPDFLHFEYRGDPSTEALIVAVERGRGADIAARVADDAAAPIDDVRGHPAWSLTKPPGNGFETEQLTILWQEEPGVVVSIETFGAGLDEDDLRDVADDMHIADPAEWHALDESQSRSPG